MAEGHDRFPNRQRLFFVAHAVLDERLLPGIDAGDVRHLVRDDLDEADDGRLLGFTPEERGAEGCQAENDEEMANHGWLGSFSCHIEERRAHGPSQIPEPPRPPTIWPCSICTNRQNASPWT